MKPSLSHKAQQPHPEGSDPLLPILSLMLLLLPILIGHVSFADLLLVEVKVPPRAPGSVASRPSDGAPPTGAFFHVLLGERENLTEVVEEATGRRLTRLVLMSDRAMPSLVRTEFLRVRRNRPELETVLLESRPEVPYETFVGVLSALQAPPTDGSAFREPQLVVVPSGGR